MFIQTLGRTVYIRGALYGPSPDLFSLADSTPVPALFSARDRRRGVGAAARAPGCRFRAWTMPRGVQPGVGQLPPIRGAGRHQRRGFSILYSMGAPPWTPSCMTSTR